MFNVRAAISLLPDSLFVTFLRNDDGGGSYTLMLKAAQTLDMGKVGLVQQVMSECFRRQDEDGLAKAQRRLQETLLAPPTWGNTGMCIAFFASSFSASLVLFNGSWVDGGFSGLLGLAVAVLYILSSHFPVIYAPVFEIFSCVLVAVLARALQSYCCFINVTISAILILLPGYSMTMAVVCKGLSN